MTSDTPASPHEQLTFTYDDRHWRVRGLEKQLSCERLKVNLLVERRELVHVDTLDLYAARLRKMFVKEAAAELFVEEATIKQDLGRVLCELESQQEALIRAQLLRHTPEAPRMSEAQRHDALELLHDPQLVERILADYQRCGLVGEETNKLICYLACTSRHLPRPLSVLIQSSSASGKTSLVDATLAFMPAEQQIRLSALTGQSLYYMGRTELKHKILAVAEEEGVSEAAYALKLLQSDARLAIASAGKDSDTGRARSRTAPRRTPAPWSTSSGWNAPASSMRPHSWPMAGSTMCLAKARPSSSPLSRDSICWQSTICPTEASLTPARP